MAESSPSLQSSRGRHNWAKSGKVVDSVNNDAGSRKAGKGNELHVEREQKKLAKFAGNIKYSTQNICFVLIFSIIINRHMLYYIENQLKATREVKSAEKQ